MNRREFGQTLASYTALGGWQANTKPPIVPGGALTDVPGIRVGHFTDTRRPTGCTAILFDAAYAAGVDYNGSAPGESQVVMLQPVSPVERIHALYLTGGGIFAIPASAGVLKFLEERKVGFDWGTPDLRIPIVVTAVIDDLAVGNPRIRPDAEAAYKACAAATTGPVAEGNVGAGAGARRANGTMADSVEVMREALTEKRPGPPLDDNALRSTTLAVVATNVTMTKTALTKLAMMANCGAGRAIRPYHTTGDGDQLFAVSTAGLTRTDIALTTLGALAADVIAEAIVRGVRAAESVEGWPGLR